MTQASRIRVVIADDHDLFRSGLAVFVRTCPELDLVGEAGRKFSAAEGANVLASRESRTDIAPERLRPLEAVVDDVAPLAARDFALLIGDPAIEFRRRHPEHPVLDLGSAWQELTGLPFVYAVWTLRRDADTRELRTELLRAFERGKQEFDDLVREAPGFDEDFRRRYLTEHVTSHLGDAEKAGIARFVDLLRRHQIAPVHVPEYVR